MQNERIEAQKRLIELNSKFLSEVESGRGWADVQHLMEEMKEVAKMLDHVPAAVVSRNSYPHHNNLGEPGI